MTDEAMRPLMLKGVVAAFRLRLAVLGERSALRPERGSDEC